jgi:hypothetical protein
MTLMLAGSDTTATTLAFALWELSRRPEVLAAVTAEVDAAAARLPAAAAHFGADDVAAMPLLGGVVNESLRLYSAAPSTRREAAADAELGGYFIPKGAAVSLDIWALHRCGGGRGVWGVLLCFCSADTKEGLFCWLACGPPKLTQLPSTPHHPKKQSHEDFWPKATEWLPERWLPSNAAALAPHAATAWMPFSVGPRSCIGRYFALLEAQVRGLFGGDLLFGGGGDFFIGVLFGLVQGREISVWCAMPPAEMNKQKQLKHLSLRIQNKRSSSPSCCAA